MKKLSNQSMILALIGWGLVACSPNQLWDLSGVAGTHKSSGGNTENADRQLETRDTTDRTSCSGAPSENMSLTNNPWVLNYEFTNGATVTQYISFQQDFMTVEYNCNWRNQTKTARVKVPVQISKNEFKILQGDHDEVSMYSGNDTFYCVADVPSDTVQYSFTGDCLSFDFPDRPIVLPSAIPHNNDERATQH
jgi:hypothetical protein